MRQILLILFSLFLLAAPAQAAPPQTHHTTATLFSAVAGVDKLTSVPVGVAVMMEDGWKTYWRTPGEAGLAPVFDWGGSTNVKEARVQWPAPTRFTAFDIDNFGYDGRIIFPIDVTPEQSGKPIALNLRLDLLICNKICVPESHTLSLAIPAGEAKVTPEQDLRAQGQRLVPSVSGDSDLSLEKAWLETHKNGHTYLHIEGHATNAPGEDADLFVEHPSFISVGHPLMAYEPDTRALHIDAPIRDDEKIETLQEKLRASPLTLTLAGSGGMFERSLALGTNGATAEESASPLADIDVSILLVAFLGGLILNLMPCVLPVLSIKILSVLAHGGKDHNIHRWPLFRNFMASAAGILFSFWLMAGVLAMLKMSGQSLGWGIQFQHPGFLVFLIVVVSAFALNLWDVYEIPMPNIIARHLPRRAQEPTLLGHFLTGAFATLLATPCTAPFLGTAVGFALAGTVAHIFVIFTFLGLGLALPYIALALSPRLFRHMPKPGKWMVMVRRIMGLALALTAAWLVHVLVTVATQPTLDDGWTAFSESLIAPAVADGKTVIVDITADWCLTCKANKRLVLDQDDVVDALSAPNILRLQADWTQRNETIAAYLRKYGRYGVPFDIVYGPGAPQGIILGELLTKPEVIRALSEASDE